MKTALAGNTSLTKYCLEYLCRAGVADLSLILPRKNHVDGYDRADFDSLAGEFSLPVLQMPFAKDEATFQGTDIVVNLEWPDKLRLPLRPNHGIISTNLRRQFSNDGLTDIAAALCSGAQNFELQILFAQTKSDVPLIIDTVTLSIFPIDNLRSLKTKAAAAIARKLHGILSHGKIPEAINISHQFETRPLKIDRTIDWFRPASELQNKIKGFTHPGPGCLTRIEDNHLLIWHGHEYDRSDALYESAEPGTVLDIVEEVGVIVQTATGPFLITKIQQFGSPELPSWVWAHGFHLKAGDKFDVAKKTQVLAYY